MRAGGAAHIGAPFNAPFLSIYSLCCWRCNGARPAAPNAFIAMAGEHSAASEGLGGVSVGCQAVLGVLGPHPHPAPPMDTGFCCIASRSPFPPLSLLSFPRIPFKIGQPKKQIVPKTVSKAIPRF